MTTNVFVITHKKVLIPEIQERPEYIVLQCGSNTDPDLGYLRANTKDNIGDLNWFYCELTGYYWAWKNITCDLIGIVHYHRFLYYDQLLLTQKIIEELLNDYDFIVPRKSGHGKSFYHTWLQYQTETDALDKLGSIIQVKYPAFYASYLTCLHTNNGKWARNIMITRKDVFNQYCSFLFSILEDLRPLLIFHSHPTNWRRPTMLGGYLGELLLNVWITTQGCTTFSVELKSYGWRNFDMK
ncbi:MAG: DUF4422 domain-containing protein [bacterium]|nr:DUF4422 domain-containing protein [bacterium]